MSHERQRRLKLRGIIDDYGSKRRLCLMFLPLFSFLSSQTDRFPPLGVEKKEAVVTERGGGGRCRSKSLVMK